MTRKLTAVVIDDLDLFRSLLREVLQERGYQVATFASPAEFTCSTDGACRCSSNQNPPDLLLTDKRMNPFSGLELIEEQINKNCRQLARNRAILSGTWTQEEKEKADRLGCKIFEKPCHLARLTTWLDQCESGDSLG